MKLSKRISKLGVELFYEFLGSALLALGINNFAMAAQLPLVGFSGIAYLLNYLFSFPVGWSTIVLNIPVAILCFRVLGKGFFVRSMRCMFLSSLIVDYIAPLFPVYHGERLLAAIATGVCMGLGLAIIYIRNTSTGGMDFITMSVKAWFPHLPLGKIAFALDIAVVSISSFIFQDIDGFIYGMIVGFLISVVVDKVIFGVNAGKLAVIVTEHGEKVCDVIGGKIHRGSTIIPGIGGYQKTEKQVVISVCSTKQMVELQKVVKSVDPASFTIILDSNEVHGTGFSTVQFGDLVP